jgi:cytoskeleton-associated protein 5
MQAAKPAALPVVNRVESRLVSGSTAQFRLDLDDGDVQDNYSMPKLIEPDLHEILNEPVKLPVTRMRPPSPAVKLLHTSTDAKSAVDLVVSQIASSDVHTSLQALHQIDEVLKDDEKCEALVSHVDQLLITCTLQLRVTYSKHMSLHLDGSYNSSTMHHDVLSLYKCLLATLLSLCQRKNLAHEATRDVLKDLIYNLITILLDSRLNELEDGQNVARSVNVAVVRIVEKADPTNVMSALIKLLQESVGMETCSTHFLELIMKCLWKMVRMMPTVIGDMNIDRILADMHYFLKAYPSCTWKHRQSDMPLRTVKTILHTFVKIKGSKILNHLSLIDRTDQQPSEVDSYLRKLVRSVSTASGTGLVASDSSMEVSTTNSRNEQFNNSSADFPSLSPKSDVGRDFDRRSPHHISRTIHDTLSDIFKKIGSKENTREGLNDLYDFKLQYPDADLNPFLKKSTQFFQDYIHRGLQNIEAERQAKQKSSSSSAHESAGTGSSTGSVTDVSAADYLERLKVLRARCGLDNDVKSSTDSTSSETGSAKLRTVMRNVPDSSSLMSNESTQNANTLSDTTAMASQQLQPSNTSSLSNIDDLKKRLDRIKNAVKD